MRRATVQLFHISAPILDFYPRPPCGGRRDYVQDDSTTKEISIHALRAEGDSRKEERAAVHRIFLSTPSVRRATFTGTAPADYENISIHALRAEGDTNIAYYRAKTELFLSTPSVRRATYRCEVSERFRKFLSTPSVRRATCLCADRFAIRTNFYPRPPCGGRPGLRISDVLSLNFYPRPPCGGRLRPGRPPHRAALFLSTPSVRRATCSFARRMVDRAISIHALRAEGDQRPYVVDSKTGISIHALRAEGDVLLRR